MDWGVFSSAEIFVQELMSMPNSHILGTPTDASSLYGDLRFDATPSGLIFTVPTKVFHGLFSHHRSPKQSINPDMIIEQEIDLELEGKDSILLKVEKLINQDK